ncbi:MAG TPA: glycerophosphodiester phosphodiesterase family protein [Pyrinomonadaceae bacterium]|nr:glycerophosphodiester phosphodiesterase family protein [Pyrinomonadaceae bacterium]
MKPRKPQATPGAPTNTTPRKASPLSELSDENFPLVVGHRGASKVAPENTLAAFERALFDGADGIEFDVRLARDSVPVVIHDATLRRTSALHLDAPIASLSSAALSAIDAGTWFNRRFPARAQNAYAHETIPTLSRVFQTIAPRCRVLYVELKCEARDVTNSTGGMTKLVEQVVAEVRTHGLERRVVIGSFVLPALAEVKRIAPDLRTIATLKREFLRPLLTSRSLLRHARAWRADELALRRALASRRMVTAAHAAGLPSVVWTVDHPSWARRGSALGLRAIITNDPARMRAALDDFRAQHDPASQRKE